LKSILAAVIELEAKSAPLSSHNPTWTEVTVGLSLKTLAKQPKSVTVKALVVWKVQPTVVLA
jgi:hypothetical protein